MSQPVRIVIALLCLCAASSPAAAVPRGAVAAVPSKPADHFEPAPVENLHLFINPIRDINKPLLFIRREAYIERSPLFCKRFRST